MTERNDSELSEGEKEVSQTVLTGSLIYVKEISQIFLIFFLFVSVLIGSLLYVKEVSQIIIFILFYFFGW